jgi:hypothetical protein
MRVKKIMKVCLPGIMILTGPVQAARIVFTGAGGDRCWTNEANWVYHNSNPIQRGIPTAADEVRMNPNTTVLITTPVTARYLKTGVNGQNTVIIDGGSLVTTGPTDYNSAGQNAFGTIIVKNGGSALFNSRFFTGNTADSKGWLIIEGGSVRVAGIYSQHLESSETNLFLTRTTVGDGGLLDVDSMILKGGVIDLTGGKVVVRTGRVEEINQWIDEGRIVAMGGAAGWKIKVTVDPAAGYIILGAEPLSAPSAVGMRRPVPSCFGKKRFI